MRLRLRLRLRWVSFETQGEQCPWRRQPTPEEGPSSAAGVTSHTCFRTPHIPVDSSGPMWVRGARQTPTKGAYGYRPVSTDTMGQPAGFPCPWGPGGCGALGKTVSADGLSLHVAMWPSVPWPRLGARRCTQPDLARLSHSATSGVRYRPATGKLPVGVVTRGLSAPLVSHQGL